MFNAWKKYEKRKFKLPAHMNLEVYENIKTK